MDQKQTIGNNVSVKFVNLRNQEIEGKVDTGATTSSLHAVNIKVDQGSHRVSFQCPELSHGNITMQLDGAQEVVSADAGGTTRPTVNFDVEINGVLIKDATFNLNDRGEMDSPILVGQNILKAGGFVVDVNADDHQADTPDGPERPKIPESFDAVWGAINTLLEHNVTLNEIVEHLKAAAVNRIK